MADHPISNRKPSGLAGAWTGYVIFQFLLSAGGCQEPKGKIVSPIDPHSVTTKDLNDHYFILIPAGTYWVGATGHNRNPRRQVNIKEFEIADTETTNQQFAKFVAATGYVTDAERRGEGQTFKVGMLDWEWHVTKGADWRHPFGPTQEDYHTKLNHPVTQISGADAEAYCRWAGVRLPTLEEWEIAARAGATSRFPWGDDFAPSGRAMANAWNGSSHRKNDLTDGFLYTSPVRSFPPNAWGLYDVIGNVFEYCSNTGRGQNGRPDPNLVTGRGGSWWCSTGTCNFFNLIDVGQMDRHGSLCNQGFRVVRSAR